jgi:hypothetical protein
MGEPILRMAYLKVKRTPVTSKGVGRVDRHVSSFCGVASSTDQIALARTLAYYYPASAGEASVKPGPDVHMRPYKR